MIHSYYLGLDSYKYLKYFLILFKAIPKWEIHAYTEWKKKTGYRAIYIASSHISIYVKYTFLDAFIDEVDS